jgi:hypothetical protein
VVHCTPRLTAHLKSTLAQVAELGLIEFGKGAAAPLTTQQFKGGFRQSLVAGKTDVTELTLIEVGKSS